MKRSRGGRALGCTLPEFAGAVAAGEGPLDASEHHKLGEERKSELHKYVCCESHHLLFSHIAQCILGIALAGMQAHPQKYSTAIRRFLFQVQMC